MKPITVTRAHYQTAYKLGVRKHAGEVTITTALRELEAMGLKRSTAADLVYNATHLLNGRRYTRMLSVAATDDYLRWIRRDFKGEGLHRAVAALEKHITYYEALPTQKAPLHAHREVLERHRAILRRCFPEIKKTTLDLEWRDSASSGWIDFLPLHWFTKETAFRGREHLVCARNGRDHARARCDVTVSNNVAELNYEAHAEFNADQGMYLGIARLYFSDIDRSQISKLEWRSKGGTAFKPHPFRTSTLKVPDEVDYVRPTDKAPHKSVMQRQRAGQAAFRRRLKGAYNHTCCMSGCDVSDALEGAHIDPFRSKASDNLRNGLLLRRDLHALYDRHFLAIDPQSHKIHVAESIRTATGYAALHGKMLRRPQNPTHRPDVPALKRRWALFQTRNK